VAAGAVLVVERREVHYLRRSQRATVGPRTARKPTAAHGQGERRTGHEHALPHRSSCGSRPARCANDAGWEVASRAERATTRPATSPKAIWEARNQGHSMRWFNAGLIRLSVAAISPVQSSGTTRPPHQTGWRGTIGRSAP